MSFLQLHAQVKFVAGQQVGALYDLQGGRIRSVPLVLGSLLDSFASLPLQEILHQVFGGDEALFRRYTDFLLREDWAFVTDRPECYPPASLAWESAYRLNTAIVAHAPDSPYSLAAALEELSAAGCRHLELQLRDYPTEDEREAVWRQIGNVLGKCEFRRGTLVQSGAQAAGSVSVTTVGQRIRNWPRFGTVVLLGRAENRNLEHEGKRYHLRKAPTLAEYARRTWQRNPQTHFVGPAYFREARVANPYFNRRLAVTAEGRFKNDLLYGGAEDFGRVGARPIAEVIADPVFRERWFASPDKITETKGDPMRYCLRYDRAIRRAATGGAEWSFSAA
ncbi:MAG: hypothetical protein AAFN92_10460 [Bacteroidota bacterium]